MTLSHSLAKATAPSPTIIAPRRPVWARLINVWHYRELLYFLAWRDIKVRYKQTLLGAAWAILQPLAMMLVFSLFFGRLAHLPSERLPYPVFYYAALVPWTYFATVVTNSTESLVSHQTVITRVYFPRVLLPMSTAVAGLVDLGLAFLTLVGLVAIYGFTPSLRFFWLIPLFALALLTAFTAGLWLSAFNAMYRDVRYMVPFLVQFWLFASPIAYSSSMVPKSWRAIYGLNPIAGIVEGFRWSLTGSGLAPGPMLAASAGTVLLLLALGLWYFQRSETTIVDRV